MRLMYAGLIAGALCVAAWAQNRAPVVNAGKDTTTRLGIAFNFSFVAASDPDDDPLTYAWTRIAGPAGGDSIIRPAALGTRVVFFKTGDYQFRIAVSDGLLTSSDTIRVTVLDSVVPAILAPAGGEKLSAGSAFMISWQLNNPGTPVNIHLSTDSGLTWEVLNQGRITGGSFLWTITQAPSGNCQIMITPYGESKVLAVSGMFAITHESKARAAGRVVRLPAAAGAGFLSVYQVDGKLIPLNRRRAVSITSRRQQQ